MLAPERSLLDFSSPASALKWHRLLFALSSLPMLELDIIDEAGSWHRFSFDTLPIDVGRDPNVHLVLPAPNISNEHCRLATQGGKVVLTDLGSTNGTFVNGLRVRAPVVIGPADRISVGPYVLLLARTD